MQLDLFKDNSDIGLLKQEIELTRTELGNLRRGIFARQGALLREFTKMCDRVAELEKLHGCEKEQKIFELIG